MAKRIYRFACFAALAFWMGGFTFYAVVVVPIGSRLLGSVEQGLVTQQVTQWMNWSGVVALAVLLPEARQTRWLLGSWILMAAMQGLLIGLHPRLDSLIDGSLRSLIDEQRFYRWHQAYLAAATVQWLAALVYLWNMTAGDAAPRANDHGLAAAGAESTR